MISPILDLILVKPDSIENETASGLYVPESSDEQKAITGTVIGIGPDEEVTIENNSKVVFFKGSGTEVEYNKEQYVFLKEAQLLGKITG